MQISKNALDLDLTTTREIARSQTDEIEELKGRNERTEIDLLHTQERLERQEAENTSLNTAITQANAKMEDLTARNESLKKELDANRKALHSIRSAAVRVSSSIRKH